MSDNNALFTVGVFGVAVEHNPAGRNQILVNVRTDQVTQRVIAGLNATWPGRIVDLPGGGVNSDDTSFIDALSREIKEETGYDAEIVGDPVGPYTLINLTNPTKPIRDVAFGYLVRLNGRPKESSEASEHLWLTLAELEIEEHYRFPGKLGKSGRMFAIARACLEKFEESTRS